ncbi:alpha-1-antiproteinase-like [Rana temporaria]|uniref:alpha-1-antiproteinase-like n=1 Tax=Rana temporaria TaxID=8407 RepID=UPI001AAD8FB2|nr:alpha-1-antiproteinase-like [Rana temporaria]
MKFLLILLLLIPVITKKDQVLSAAIIGNTDIQEGLSPTNAEAKNKEAHRLFCILLPGWNEPNGDLHPPNGNVIFLDNSLTLPKNFQDDVQNNGNAKILEVDFRHPKEAEKEINDYVKSKTEGKTGDVVKDLSKDTKMVLINYSLIKGKWRVTFHTDNAKFGKFFDDEKTTVDVPMMNLTGLFNTYHATDLPCTVAELPYNDDESMIIAMAEPSKINEVERGLSAETVQRPIYWFVNLTFIFLGKPLLSLGTRTASTDDAEFSRIGNDVNHKEGKALMRIIIKEEGTSVTGSIVLEATPTQEVLLLQTDINDDIVMTEDLTPGVFTSVKDFLKWVRQLQND